MILNKSLHNFDQGQRGFVLIFALVILVTLTLLGFIASRTAIMEMTLSSNDRAHRQAFSLADGGTDAATSIYLANTDCATGFPATLSVSGKSVGAIRFSPSGAFNGDAATAQGMNYTVKSLRINTSQNPLPPGRDSAASPEIIRHFCIGGEGINTQPGSFNGCNPTAADAGAPHTNILYYPDPNNTGTSHPPGEGLNNPGSTAPLIITQVDIYSQHVTYQGGTVTKEAIIRMGWQQVNDPSYVANCAASLWGK